MTGDPSQGSACRALNGFTGMPARLLFDDLAWLSGLRRTGVMTRSFRLWCLLCRRIELDGLMARSAGCVRSALGQKRGTGVPLIRDEFFSFLVL